MWTNVVLLDRGLANTTSAEIRASFGIILIMSLVKINNMDDYWSSLPGLKNQLISKTMRRTRFYQLSRFLQCTDPAKNPANKPKETAAEKQKFFLDTHKKPLYPLQEIWDSVLNQCQANYNPRSELAIDEAMVRYKGYKGVVKKFFMQSKPIRVGFKIYALCESTTSYMLNFQVHPSNPSTIYNISKQLIRPYFEKYHHVFCDRLYTSIPLARKLQEHKTYLTGAIQKNRKGQPLDLSTDSKKNPRKHKSIANMGKTKRGTMYIRQQGQLTYSMWHDTKILTILSSGHQAFRNKATDVVRRKFSLDGVARSQEHQVPAPTQVIDYIANMGGVDRHDQLRSYHTCSRKSQIWWKQLLFFLIDISRVNAFLLYKGARNNPMDQSKFVYQIADGLIDGYPHGNIERQNIKVRTVGNFNAPGHRLEQIAGADDNPQVCVACLRAGRTCNGRLGKPIRTKWGCKACGTYFCRMTKNPVCFDR